MSIRASSPSIPVLAFLVALGGAGCGSSVGGEEPSDAYYTGALSAGLGVTGNQASCATCHSNDGTQEHISGNTLKDIAYHTSFKGGMAPDLLSAVNACVTGWMGGEALTADDEAYVQLEAYLQSISSETATTPNEIAPVVLANEAAYEEAYTGGDAAAGQAKFASACASCHANGLVVGGATPPRKADMVGYTIGRLAQKVRTSGPPPSGMEDASDTTPGPMPFFEAKDLSAADLKDIIAHIKGS